MRLATEEVETGGFRVVGAARDGADRLVAAVRRFHGESGHEVGPEQAVAIHALCADASLGRPWLLADGRGRDVGYALTYWRHSVGHGGRVAVLDEPCTGPGSRGRGLVARLLRVALAGMEEAGARAVVVEADPADAPAMSFYARPGFAPKGTADVDAGRPRPDSRPARCRPNAKGTPREGDGAADRRSARVKRPRGASGRGWCPSRGGTRG